MKIKIELCVDLKAGVIIQGLSVNGEDIQHKPEAKQSSYYREEVVKSAEVHEKKSRRKVRECASLEAKQPGVGRKAAKACQWLPRAPAT